MSDFNELDASEAEEHAVNYIRKGMRDDDIEMVLVVCNTKLGLASILSMKMDEEDVVLVLAAAAATIVEGNKIPQDRVLN